MTDLRRYRPDHLVPENALPGAVFLTEAELGAARPAADDSCRTSTSTARWRSYQRALRAHAVELELDADAFGGLRERAVD